MQQISRRSFLKIAAATATVVALPPSLNMNFKAFAGEAMSGEVTRIPSLCNGCSSYCGVWAYVKNGRLWKVEGNETHMKSRGTLCARGHAVAYNVYDTGRVTQPMKRIKDNKFKPISWEEAFQEVGSKMRQLVEEHGGDKVIWACHGGKETYAQSFLNVLGSNNYITHYATCFIAKSNIWQQMCGGMYNPDLDNANYMLFAGRNYAGGIIPGAMKSITEAKSKGVKIVVVDPRFCELAAIADEWVPIRAGTDLALFLGIAHTLITENLYDQEFVDNYVYGFDEFWMHNKDFNAEKAAEITGIPADKIKEIARELAKNAPRAFFDPGYHNSRYQNTNETVMINVIVNALLGNFWQAGGLFPSASTTFGHPEETYFGTKAVMGSRADGAGVAGEYPLVEPSRGIPQRIPDMIEKGRAKVVLIYSYNPLRTAPDPEYQKGIKNAELVVSIPYDWNETSVYTADYILPENHYLERTEHPKVINGNIHYPSVQIATRFKALESPAGSLDLLDIMKGVTTAYGLENLYGFTVEEELEVALGPLGISPDELREKGCIELKPTVLPKGKEEELTFSTFTGKIEFSLGAWKKEGYLGVPTWIPTLVEPKGDHEFRLIHGKQPWHSHVMTSNNPYLMAITKETNGTYIWMNASRAAKLGVKEGDWVTAESEITKKKVQIHVTEGIHPECVYAPSSYGLFSDKLEHGYGKGINFNDFIPARVDEKTGHVMGQECIVRITKGVK